MKTRTNPMQRENCQPLALRQCRKCGAANRQGLPCAAPAVSGKTRCRMHGGAAGSGAPTGRRNGSYKSGQHTNDAIGWRRQMRDWLSASRATLDDLK